VAIITSMFHLPKILSIVNSCENYNGIRWFSLRTSLNYFLKKIKGIASERNKVHEMENESFNKEMKAASFVKRYMLNYSLYNQ